jgi:hypothetical protein
MEKVITHYMHLGYKVTFQRGALHHIEVGLMKNLKVVTQHIKDDHITEGYLEEVFEHIHSKFSDKKATV